MATEAAAVAIIITSMNTKCKRIVPDTISGLDLRQRENDAIMKLVGIPADEPIEVINMWGGNFEEYFDLATNILVGLTGKRIFEIRNGIPAYVMFDDVHTCYHKRANIVRWDHVVITRKNGTTKEFGIYYGKTVEHFIQFIKSKIEAKLEFYPGK